MRSHGAAVQPELSGQLELATAGFVSPREPLDLIQRVLDLKVQPRSVIAAVSFAAAGQPALVSGGLWLPRARPTSRRPVLLTPLESGTSLYRAFARRACSAAI